jgi:8-oxo-dGTP pyrophosphatase MutT (NUDIX family)
MDAGHSVSPQAGDSRQVRAGGGVVLRAQGKGQLEVLLVHRPRYDDWTLPKGKAAADESDEQCALREVEEETGLRCTLGRELVSTEYVDRKNRAKVVRYWEMTPIAGIAAGQNEVDEVAWLPLADAIAKLTYERDVAVLRSLDTEQHALRPVTARLLDHLAPASSTTS